VTDVRPFSLVVVALVALTVGSACDRSPTEPPQPAALSASRAGSSSSLTAPTGRLSGSAVPDQSVTQLIGLAGTTICITPRCVKSKLKLRGPSRDGRSNYVVAW